MNLQKSFNYSLKNVLYSSILFKNFSIKKLKLVVSSFVLYGYKTQTLTLLEGIKLKVLDEPNISNEEGKYDVWGGTCIVFLTRYY